MTQPIPFDEFMEKLNKADPEKFRPHVSYNEAMEEITFTIVPGDRDDRPINSLVALHTDPDDPNKVLGLSVKVGMKALSNCFKMPDDHISTVYSLFMVAMAAIGYEALIERRQTSSIALTHLSAAVETKLGDLMERRVFVDSTLEAVSA